MTDRREGFDLVRENPKGHRLLLDTYSVFDAIIPTLCFYLQTAKHPATEYMMWVMKYPRFMTFTLYNLR